MIRNEAHYMTVRKHLYTVQRDMLYCGKYGDAGTLLALGNQQCLLQEALSEYDAFYHGDRKGRWMPLYSGGRIWPEDPSPQDITLIDIAHVLGKICRYNGHLRGHYSVAQHCVMGSYHIDPKYATAFLYHDSGETYLGDLITPIKRLLREFYEPIEERVVQAVAIAFGFEMGDTAHKLVKEMDIRMLETEVRDLVPAGLINHSPTELPLDERIEECWDASYAEHQFIKRAVELNASQANAA